MLLAECMVCFETLESGKVIYAAPCGHILHHACWVGCLRTSNTCPQCRKPTSENRLLRLYITYSEITGTVPLQNEIDVLRCELNCKVVELEKAEKILLARTFDVERLRAEIVKFQGVESKMIQVTEILKEREKEIETLKKFKEENLKLKKAMEEFENLKQQTVELKKAKAHLEKFKDQTIELRKVKSELEKIKKEPPITRKSKEEMAMIRKYQGVVEGLKQCLHEYDQLKKSNNLVKKLKIYTDDISGDVKNDVKKDPQKYAEMFQEVKKYWNWVGKREDEVKKSPKGCVIHLTGFPPNRKDVTKVDIQGRLEYYDAKVAFVTYTRGGLEAFVRLKPPLKGPAHQRKDPADLQKNPADLQKNPDDLQKNPADLQKNPADLQKNPADLQENPADLQKNPADLQKNPADLQKNPADLQENPADLQKNPADLIVEKLPEGKLRIKNFTVNAIALQGEEELKFLRRSLDDRDRKIGRVNCDVDYYDENEEVTMLEYMMNLVAVA